MQRRRRSTSRLFALYALASVVPVLMLGVVLAASFRSEADQRGLAQGRAEAQQIATAALEPLLSGRSLTQGLAPEERAAVARLTSRVIQEASVLRLRIRNLDGVVVFSDDGSGLRDKPDDEALDAARGKTVAYLTRLNSDANDSGPRGTPAVEVYLPLAAGSPVHRVGVLEIYLPYAPIQHAVAAGQRRLLIELVVGLLILYLVLFGISASLSRGLRREAVLNAFLAEHDVLTGLPNRTLFLREGRTALARGGRAPRTVTVAILDLDRFKDINDALGHHSGDELLGEIARRLQTVKRADIFVARLGGDEFGVIVEGQQDPEPALRHLLDVLDEEVEVNGLPLTVQASLGFACAPDAGTDIDELLQHADLAMYAAKAQHAGLLRYDASLDQFDARSLALVAQLRHAIDTDELCLHYQPQIATGDRGAHAVEALVRWRHPEAGLLYPDSFLPLAEQTDVIHKLTRWVLNRALQDLAMLQEAEPELCVAVNVSARNLGHESFAEEVIELLRHHGVPGHRLIVEVTETALMTDPQRAADVLRRLVAAGIDVSLDDFGQGQTSLGYLSDLPLRELKIDRAFVFDMLTSPAHGAIVRSIIELGHNLGLRVVAEGVEDDETCLALTAAGCDLLQGYLFARPMPPADLVNWLRKPAGELEPAV